MATPNELRRLKDFAAQNPEAGSLDALRWQIRNRRVNGMLESGAVVEFYPGEKHTRPVLFIDVPRYWRWQRGECRRTAA